MKKLLRFMKGYGARAVTAPLFKLLEAIMELLVPLLVASIIDIGITSGDTSYIIRRVILMVVFGIVGLGFAVTAQYFSAMVAVGYTGRVRRALFAHLGTLSHAELDQIGTPTLITRLTADMNQIQNGVNLTLRLLMRSPFIVFGATIMAFTIDSRAALVFVGLIPVLTVVIFAIMLYSVPLYKKVQEALDRVLSHVRQNLTGVRVLRAFGKEQEEREEFRKRTASLCREQIRVGAVSSLMNPLTYCIVNIAILILVYVGALRVRAGALPQGRVVALYSYMAQILVELVKLANLIINITRSIACGNRVQSIFELTPSIVSKPDAVTASVRDIPVGEPLISYENVSLQYNGAASDMLTDISFDIRRGEFVGIIGGTGSGKTSLIQLLPRFYDVTQGTVRFCGHDVRDWDTDALRNAVRVIPQKAVLFAGTVRSNLLWGRADATDDELWEALRLACAEDFIRNLPEGLDAPVSKGGSNFSGGQRQRLTIARALVSDAPVLIFDDSSSALDFATEKALRNTLASQTDRTVLYISQRPGSLQACDRILVLEDGALVGNGTPNELPDTCPVYREMAALSGLIASAEGGAV